ncbi:[Fe-Fe] hydrogenase large subunit C-terminal domain-containing protein [Clostridiaceae bacterium M8S5]|nr:[Fe-Fe] hydrogenase large subunit C-terminal domain-containing protein [Clostridiaceae bacterium M8S5]
MKKYIWLNPVTSDMLTNNNINVNELFKNLGYILVDLDCSIVDNVLSDYINMCKSTNNPLIDSRCPMVVEIIKEKYPELCKNIAPLDPIFIYCAKHLYKTLIKSNDDSILFIIAPCTSLCHYGNAVLKKDVIFTTWKHFKEKHEICIDLKARRTPIPLGFFDNTDLIIEKLTGESKILSNINKLIEYKSNIDLIEILYCKNGCHNGDGI